MSAPSIPNLLSSRGRGGGGGGGGGGRGGLRSRRGGALSSASRADNAIQGTDTDAAVSRMSAVDLGYLTDPYAKYFISQMDGPNPRRLPIINRGTYTRTQALDNLIDAFIATDESEASKPTKQIISLGAGTDTRPFKLFNSADSSHIIYHELDFDVTSKKKLQLVRGIPVLSKILTDISTNDTGSWTSHPAAGGEYHAHGIDLRSLQDDNQLPGLRSDVPTLILSECCLCYVQRIESERVIQYFTSRIPNLSIALYEPMHLDDAFGDTMVSNLAARHISMPGLQAYRNAKDQIGRLIGAGFTTAKYMTIDNSWEDWVSQEEKERVHQLEGLDEVEEWKLLAGHYIVAWGYRGEGFTHMGRIKGK